MGKDPDNRRFIYQAIDEGDKNHNEKDTTATNQARIYEVPGIQVFFFFMKRLTKQNSNISSTT